MRQRAKDWTVAELVPPILLGLVGATLLLAASAGPFSWTIEPSQKQPRISPAKPPPVNRSKVALVISLKAQPAGAALIAERPATRAIALAS